MTGDQHDLFIRFFKLKPPVFKRVESEEAYDFLVDCHELLNPMDIVERIGVEFVTYQFQGDAKMWWRSYVECQPDDLGIILQLVYGEVYTPEFKG